MSFSLGSLVGAIISPVNSILGAVMGGQPEQPAVPEPVAPPEAPERERNRNRSRVLADARRRASAGLSGTNVTGGLGLSAPPVVSGKTLLGQ